MSYNQPKMTSGEYSIWIEMKANERRILEGPKDADGRPMPSAFAQACEAKRRLEQAAVEAPNIVILQRARTPE